MNRRLISAALVCALSACTTIEVGPEPEVTNDDAGTDAAPLIGDAAPVGDPDARLPDAEVTAPDAESTTPDAEITIPGDAATPGDATTPDAATPDDASAPDDAATPDASAPDDAATPDASVPDAALDASEPDASLPDAMIADAAVPTPGCTFATQFEAANGFPFSLSEVTIVTGAGSYPATMGPAALKAAVERDGTLPGAVLQHTSALSAVTLALDDDSVRTAVWLALNQPTAESYEAALTQTFATGSRVRGNVELDAALSFLLALALQSSPPEGQAELNEAMNQLSAALGTPTYLESTTSSIPESLRTVTMPSGVTYTFDFMTLRGFDLHLYVTLTQGGVTLGTVAARLPEAIVCGSRRVLGSVDYMTTPQTYPAALADCESRGGYLAGAEGADIFLLRALMRNDGAAWAGASDSATEGTYLLADGVTPPPYTPFVPGQPDDADGTEDCAVMRDGTGGVVYGWTDEVCTQRLPYLCVPH